MSYQSWIKSSDRKPTAADLPVEVYFGLALAGCNGPVVCEFLKTAEAPYPGVRSVDMNDTYTHWRPYRPLTPEQLTVEPTAISGVTGGASLEAFGIIVRAGQAWGKTNTRESTRCIETVARELEDYAKQKADEAAASLEVENDRIKSELDAAQQRIRYFDELPYLKSLYSEEEWKLILANDRSHCETMIDPQNASTAAWHLVEYAMDLAFITDADTTSDAMELAARQVDAYVLAYWRTRIASLTSVSGSV